MAGAIIRSAGAVVDSVAVSAVAAVVLAGVAVASVVAEHRGAGRLCEPRIISARQRNRRSTMR